MEEQDLKHLRLASNWLCSEVDLQLLVLLPLPFKCWDSRHSASMLDLFGAGN